MDNFAVVCGQLKNIEFPDAEILSVFLEGGDADVVIKDWRERKIHLRFGEVVLFKTFGFGGDIFECRILTESDEINEAIKVIEQDHGTVTEKHGFVHVEFIDDAPLLVVVFSSLHIEIED